MPPEFESGLARWLERSGSSRLPQFCVLSCSGCSLDSNSDTLTKRTRTKAKCFAAGDCGVLGFADNAGISPRSRCAFGRQRYRSLPPVHHDALFGALRGLVSHSCPDQDWNPSAEAV